MNATPAPPAGWYPDPAGRAPFRYWDGTRWTEHTQQGTPPPNPVPVPVQQPIPQPVQQAPAGGGFVPPPPPGYGPAAATPQPASRAAGAGSPVTVQAFVDDIKKLDGGAIVILATLLFAIFTFLPWGNAKGTNIQTGAPYDESANAWESAAPWFVRGYDIDDVKAGKDDSGTDMIFLGPLAVAAGAIALSTRLGRKINRGPELLLGATGLLAVLMIAEIVAVKGTFDDMKTLITGAGATFEGSTSFGFYLAIAASLAMVAGAAKSFQASRQTS